MDGFIWRGWYVTNEDRKPDQETAGQEPRFMNPAEQTFAHLLDFYGISWEYEPRTFVLAEDETGRVVEAFTPDFYLPEQDLYVELTTMSSRQISLKNRKIRSLRERYPDINIRLFRRRDIAFIFQKFGEDEESVADG